MPQKGPPGGDWGPPGGDLRLMDGLEELLPLQRDTSTNCIRLAHLLLLLRPCFVGKLGTHRDRELGWEQGGDTGTPLTW